LSSDFKNREVGGLVLIDHSPELFESRRIAEFIDPVLKGLESKRLSVDFIEKYEAETLLPEPGCYGIGGHALVRFLEVPNLASPERTFPVIPNDMVEMGISRQGVGRSGRKLSSELHIPCGFNLIQEHLRLPADEIGIKPPGKGCRDGEQKDGSQDNPATFSVAKPSETFDESE